MSAELAPEIDEVLTLAAEPAAYQFLRPQAQMSALHCWALSRLVSSRTEICSCLLLRRKPG